MPLRGPRGVELRQGEVYVLEPSSAHVTIAANVAGANRFYVYGERRRFLFHVNLTAAANLVGDTLDVLIDAEAPDGSWVNAIHFPQMLGNGGAKAFFGVLDTTNPGAVTFDVSADAAVGVVRPGVFGPSFRTRYTIAGGGAQSFTFAVQAYAVR
jgi:hypothetical protein